MAYVQKMMDKLKEESEQQEIEEGEDRICKQHKRRIEFVCQLGECFQHRFLCPQCKSIHSKHPNYIITFDTYLDNMMEKQKELFNQRKQIVSERIDDIKRLSQKVTVSIEKFKVDELEYLERQFDDISMKFKEDKQSILEDFTSPIVENHSFFSDQLLQKDCQYCTIEKQAKNMLRLVQKQDFNLEKLKCVVIRQENLFKIVFEHLRYRQYFQQNIHANARGKYQLLIPTNFNEQNYKDEGIFMARQEHLQNIDDFDYNYEDEFYHNCQYFKGFIIDYFDNDFDEIIELEKDHEDGKIITSLIKLQQNIIVFSSKNTIFFYDFVKRKLLHTIYFQLDTYIFKLEKIHQSKIAVLVKQPCETKFPQQFNQVYSLEIKGRKVDKQKIFFQKQSLLKDIICIPNTQLIAVIQIDARIYIINTNNGKIISNFQHKFIDRMFQQSAITSCTLVRNITINNSLYKYLLAINFQNKTFGYLDIVTNDFITQKIENEMIYPFTYKYSKALRIQEQYLITNQAKTQNSQSAPSKKNSQNRQNNNNKQKKGTSSTQNSEIINTTSLSYFQILEHKYIIQMQDSGREEILFQKVFNGQIQHKNLHYPLLHQDLFNNQSVIPYYQHDIIYFYNHSEQTRLQKQIFISQLKRKYLYFQVDTTQTIETNCKCQFESFQKDILKAQNSSITPIDNHNSNQQKSEGQPFSQKNLNSQKKLLEKNIQIEENISLSHKKINEMYSANKKTYDRVVGVFNHHKFLVLIYTSGLIQYIQ